MQMSAAQESLILKGPFPHTRMMQALQQQIQSTGKHADNKTAAKAQRKRKYPALKLPPLLTSVPSSFPQTLGMQTHLIVMEWTSQQLKDWTKLAVTKWPYCYRLLATGETCSVSQPPVATRFASRMRVLKGRS